MMQTTPKYVLKRMICVVLATLLVIGALPVFARASTADEEGSEATSPPAEATILEATSTPEATVPESAVTADTTPAATPTVPESDPASTPAATLPQESSEQSEDFSDTDSLSTEQSAGGGAIFIRFPHPAR